MSQQSPTITWETVQETIVGHFTTEDRKATIGHVMTMRNFFEGWFTGECLIAFRRGFPHAALDSNTNYQDFPKPDIVLSSGICICIMALKHIGTYSAEASSRWDGGKNSTVAKDVHDLMVHSDRSCIKRVLVFYGPALETAHSPGQCCDPGRAFCFCLQCSLDHLRQTLAEQWKCRMPEPERIPLLQTDVDNFYLLVFSI